MQGQYPSYVIGNFADQILRNTFKLLDSNPFMTLWVNTILLESTKFPNGPLLDRNSMINSLKAVAEFCDKNRPTGDGLLVFWPQSLNTSSGKWFTNPNNIVHTVDVVWDALEAVRLILVRTHMNEVWVDYFKPVQDLM